MKTVTDPATARYIQTATAIAPLSREEELALWTMFRDSRDRRAADRLVHAHLRDVVYVARKHRFYGIPVADLIAEGNLGLMRALEKFEPAHGVRFGTYAAHWVRAYVVTHVLRSWSLVGGRSGALRSNLFFRLRRERARLETLHGPNEDVHRMLAERLHTTEDELRLMLERVDARDVSLDAPVHPESKTTIADRLVAADDAERAFEAESVRRRVSAALREALPALDPRERFIAEARWLADGDDELSLADIGRELGVSRERVRQLETRARAKIRRVLEDRWGNTGGGLDADAA